MKKECFCGLLRKQGKSTEAEQLRIKNLKIIKLGMALEPLQKLINEQEKFKKQAQENVRLSPEERNRRIAMYDKKIKDLQDRMEERYKRLKN